MKLHGKLVKKIPVILSGSSNPKQILPLPNTAKRIDFAHQLPVLVNHKAIIDKYFYPAVETGFFIVQVKEKTINI